MEEPNADLAALLTLHQGLERQGPGDAAFTQQMLSLLPPLPDNPRIADLGCGAGAATLELAQWYRAPVTAVDRSGEFLATLRARARARGVEAYVHTVEADMGALDWPSGSLDLLWSEGAAYNLTFAGALANWRRLLATKGLAVISELSWFCRSPPAAAREFWEAGYPTMASEGENAAAAGAAGYEVLGVHRLPSAAWWDNYYGPLLQRMAALRAGADGAMQSVLAATDAEIELFRHCSDAYGYSFYVLQVH
jgi:serine/threonine-protein kinase HipA